MTSMLRRGVALLLVLASTAGLAEDRDILLVDGRQNSVVLVSGETQTKFKTIWAPLGFTVGGAVATGFGAVITALGAGLASDYGPGQDRAFPYGMAIAGGVLLTAGITLLTVGIIKFVQRSNALHARYGD
jgi:hypothetical protein